MIKRFWLAAAAAAALATALPAVAAPHTAAPTAPAPKATAPAPSSAPTPEELAKAPRMGPWGFDLSGRDTAVAPGQDFFEYANGAYVKALQIPPDRSRFGAFDKLNALSQERMHAVLEKAATAPRGTEAAKVGDFYKAFMDQATVEKLGARPMAQDLAAIRAAKTRSDLARLMGQSQYSFGGAFFSASISEDAKDPEHYAVYLGQAGLGLPDRDYYLKPEFAAQRTKYQAYVAQLLKLEGWPQPEENAKAILAMETQIAQVSWDRAERRHPEKTYNPVETAKLDAFAPGFDWKAFVAGAGLTKVDRVVVAENTAFPKIAQVFATTPIATLKAWQAFQLADQASPYLSSAFDQAHFEFRDKALSGQEQQKPRWKRAVAVVDGDMGEALGKLYVAAYFPPESKAKMLSLVGDIRTAMQARIEKLDWMSPETKQKALAKLAKFRVKIAYPDKWRDYAALAIKPGDLYGDVQRAQAFDWNYRVNRLGGPVDKSEWDMTPPTINAYNNPTGNEIVFPAAILQPPFFDPDGDAAINYGGIGGVIGHELTHGFDDEGRKYDGDGRLAEWWTAEDAAKFNAQAEKLGRQYAAYPILEGSHINGALTMGENIADLGGLLLALDAYHASLHGEPAPVIDGLTGDQRVFLGWAQVWRGKVRQDYLRKQLVADPHSPNQARVDVPVRNIDAFYAAFGVKPGDPMYVAPADRVRIW